MQMRMRADADAFVEQNDRVGARALLSKTVCRGWSGRARLLIHIYTAMHALAPPHAPTL